MLALSGDGYIDAKNVGDNNLAVLSDVTLSFHAKAAQAGQAATLLAFGGAHGALNGSLNNQESANHAYEVSLTPAGYLSLAWQHDDGTWETVISNDIVADPTTWNHFEIVRDGDAQGVGFFVNGNQLGQVLGFDALPTGAGSASLYIGSGVGGDASFDGWMDAIRISNDPVALVPFVVGDFDSNGFVNGLDWLIFADALGTTGAGMTDLNGDGSTNYPDFLLFIGLFDDINGNGSFDTMLENIPEPSSFGMLLAAAAFTGHFRRKRF